MCKIRMALTILLSDKKMEKHTIEERFVRTVTRLFRGASETVWRTTTTTIGVGN